MRDGVDNHIWEIIIGNINIRAICTKNDVEYAVLLTDVHLSQVLILFFFFFPFEVKYFSSIRWKVTGKKCESVRRLNCIDYIDDVDAA